MTYKYTVVTLPLVLEYCPARVTLSYFANHVSPMQCHLLVAVAGVVATVLAAAVVAVVAASGRPSPLP